MQKWSTSRIRIESLHKLYCPFAFLSYNQTELIKQQTMSSRLREMLVYHEFLVWPKDLSDSNSRGVIAKPLPAVARSVTATATKRKFC